MGSSPSDTSMRHSQGGPAHAEILASTLDPVITINATGIIVTVSRSVERVFGWNPDELIGQNISVLMPEPYRSEHDGYLARYAETGRTAILGATRELTGRHRDGHSFPIELSVSQVELPGGGPPLFTGIIHDISNRRVAEEELAAHRERLEHLVHRRTAELESTHEQLRLADRLAAIGTLAAGLGHDMNNVLLPIRMRMDALEALELPAAARDHMREVRESVDYLQQLSDGLHLLALDPADIHASSDATNLQEWWSQAGPLLSRTMPRNVTLHVALTPDAPSVRVPSHRLTQAILNLMVNAAEAIVDRGEVRLWSRVFPDRRFVELGVTDTGQGMSPEIRRRALEPFFTTKTRGLGTGLGLSLAHGVAVGAGGTLNIDSAPGRGTTVRLTFAVADEASATSESRPAGSVILAVTDPRLRGLISLLLASNNLVCVDSNDVTADAVITDSSSFAAHEPRQRPHLLLGEAEEQGSLHSRVIVASDPHDFEQLRVEVQRLASMIHGEAHRT